MVGDITTRHLMLANSVRIHGKESQLQPDIKEKRKKRLLTKTNSSNSTSGTRSRSCQALATRRTMLHTVRPIIRLIAKRAPLRLRINSKLPSKSWILGKSSFLNIRCHRTIRGFKSRFRRIWIIFATKRNRLSIMNQKRVLQIRSTTLMFHSSLEMEGMEEIHLLRVKYSILVGKVRQAHNKPTTSFTIKRSNSCQGTVFRTFHV